MRIDKRCGFSPRSMLGQFGVEIICSVFRWNFRSRVDGDRRCVVARPTCPRCACACRCRRHTQAGRGSQCPSEQRALGLDRHLRRGRSGREALFNNLLRRDKVASSAVTACTARFFRPISTSNCPASTPTRSPSAVFVTVNRVFSSKNFRGT